MPDVRNWKENWRSMARKKKSEMTLQERVDSVMKGETWYFAEEFGIEVLARCVALHHYARKDGEEFFMNLTERICRRAGEWAKEGDHAAILAFAALGYKVEKAGGVDNYIKERRKEHYGEGS